MQNKIVTYAIFQSRWVLTILLFPFIEPQLFKMDGYAVFDTFFAIWKLISAFVIFCIYFTTFKFKISQSVLIVILLQSWIFFSTIHQHGSLTTFAGPAITMISIFMLFEISAYYDLYKFLIFIKRILLVYVILNIVVYVLMKMHFLDLPSSILGIENRWIYFILPWVFLNFFVDEYNFGRTTVAAWTSWVVGFLSLLFVWSVGAIIAMGLWPILWIIYKKKNIVRKALVLFTVYIVFSFFFTNSVILNYFNRFFVQVLHKDITLSGRIHLWRVVYDLLLQNPLFGAGVFSNSQVETFFYINSGYVEACRVNHPHNFFLYFAFKGGIPALVIFLILCVSIVIKISKYYFNVMSGCVFLGISVVLIASIVDTLDFSLVYMIFALGANIDVIVKKSRQSVRSNFED